MKRPLIPQLILLLSALLLSLTCHADSKGESKSSENKNELVANLENGKKIYELCATCHYETGWGKEDGSFPVIAGQHSSVILKQLADIQAKNRRNPTMYPFSGDDVLGGPQGRVDVAAYIADLPANANPGKGNTGKLDLGKKIYHEKCSSCHAENGLGDAMQDHPRLQGQHYAYLLRQLKWIRDGLRKNGDKAMLAELKEMDNDSMSAVADYISRLQGVAKK